jgi:hypothetical protein
MRKFFTATVLFETENDDIAQELRKGVASNLGVVLAHGVSHVIELSAEVFAEKLWDVGVDPLRIGLGEEELALYPSTAEKFNTQMEDLEAKENAYQSALPGA